MTKTSLTSRSRVSAPAIGIVPQDTVLFNDTIGYNIGYGRDEADKGEIELAAKRRRHRPVHRRPSARL